MPAIHFDAVSFRHSSAVDVLSDVALHLGPGWTGVVGANGAGKTTLLRLVSGALSPDAGSVVLDPSDAVVVTVPQSVEERASDIERFAESWEVPDHLLRQRLDLQPWDIERWPTLSPGERKRWQVAAALSLAPDVLLLDEPTNHLDVESRDLLLGVLTAFTGVGLVVSHDRPLLDGITDRTLRVHGGTAELWGGSYSTASSEWTLAREADIAAYQHLRREHKKLSRRIADRQRTAETKRSQFSRQQRTSTNKDIDARSNLVQRRFVYGEMHHAKATAKAVRQQQRMATEIDATVISKDRGSSVFLDYVPSPKRHLAHLKGDLTVGDRTLIHGLDFSVERDSRIWLRGPNGSGKTTLLERLRSEANLDPGRVLYLPQEITTADGAALLTDTRRLDPEMLGQVMSWVAALGVDPDALLASDQPSPGEVRKLALASGLGRQVWLAILDEPTNHLDLPSIERLEAALLSFPGALVVVSHDSGFATAAGLTPVSVYGGRVHS